MAQKRNRYAGISAFHLPPIYGIMHAKYVHPEDHEPSRCNNCGLAEFLLSGSFTMYETTRMELIIHNDSKTGKRPEASD
jgi:hypothetical protein